MTYYERTRALYKDIFNLNVYDGKVVATDFNIPDFARKRAAYFLQIEELTFVGLIDLILAYDEQEAADECRDVAEWLPTTEEFRQWRDSLPITGLEMLMAAYLIYGKQYEDTQKAEDI